jgi:MFS family permease
MFVSLLMAAIAFSQATGSGSDVTLGSPWGVIALIGANLFVIFFAATWGPVMWVMLGEMFPNRMRTVALGLCTAVNWITNFAVTLAFPPLTRNVGLWLVYGLFALFAGLSYFFVKARVPETTGMSLEQMEGDTYRSAASAA